MRPKLPTPGYVFLLVEQIDNPVVSVIRANVGANRRRPPFTLSGSEIDGISKSTRRLLMRRGSGVFIFFFFFFS